VNTRPITVLMVDDDEAAQLLTHHMLTKDKLLPDFPTAIAGVEALDSLRRQPPSPDPTPPVAPL